MRAWKKLTAAVLGICISASSAMTAFADEKQPFDVNSDGSFDVMDIICLTKHLMGFPSAIVDWNAADLDKDGQVDVFDLGLLKRELYTTQHEAVSDETVLLSKNYQSQSVTPSEMDEQTILGQTKFALTLLQNSAKAGENALVSPYSVSQALGMMTNGAAGDTRKEMEAVLGGSMDTLNPAFYALRTGAPQTEGVKLHTANSIWVKNNFRVKDSFLQTNADYYGADVYAAPFDAGTVKQVNQWVDTNTDHMIPEIIDDLTGAKLCLVNAVAFDGKWQAEYKDENIKDCVFHAADGTDRTVQMMYDNSVETYLEDAHATGFMRWYQDSDYAFAALLPEEGMTPEQYLDTLTPKSLHKLLVERQHAKVHTGLPEFTYDFDILLNEPLQSMGMPTAFVPGKADFSEAANGLYMEKVLHKTHIEVTPKGTRAAAATAIVTRVTSVRPVEEVKTVILDRPFVYMIVDTKTSLPVFFGTVNSIKGSQKTEVSQTETAPSYKQITQDEAKQMMASEKNAVILDVRRQDEYDAGHIPGAILLPNESIDGTRPEALPDPDQVILIYCRSGNRSKQAAEKLANMGYTHIYEFGGINTWDGDIVTDGT